MSIATWHHELYDGGVTRKVLYERFARWLRRGAVKEYTSPGGYRMLVVAHATAGKKRR